MSPAIGVQPNCWARASTRKIVLVHATGEYVSSGSSRILLPFTQNHDLYDVTIPFSFLTQYRQRPLITGKYFPGSLPIPGGPCGGGTSLQFHSILHFHGFSPFGTFLSPNGLHVQFGSGREVHFHLPGQYIYHCEQCFIFPFNPSAGR